MGVVAASAQTAGSAGPAAKSPTSPNTSATAPNSSNTAAAQPNSTSVGANEPLRQQVRENLAKAGFTDIKIMPTSFLVRAKDQSGNPVMMVMNPDSFTEVTAISPSSANQQPAPNQGSSTAKSH